MVFSVDFPDPFARVIFLNQSDSTEKLEKTLCPTWDQTLMFEEIEIHGQPESIMEKPPKVVVEIFDYDNFVSVDWNNKPREKGRYHWDIVALCGIIITMTIFLFP